MTDELIKVDLHLNPSQAYKLQQGIAVQLKHHQIGVPDMHHVMVHPQKAKKMHSAHKRMKGVRIQLSEPEIAETIGGGGFGDFLNKLKNAGQWLKKNIVDSSIYQSTVKPIARQFVDTGLQLATPHLGVAAPLARQAVDEIGRRTNAFGLKKNRKPAAVVAETAVVAVAPKRRSHKTVKQRHMTKVTVQNEPLSEDAVKKFYMESMMAPRPGGPAGFLSLPETVYGSGHSMHHHYHNYYYPHPHHGSGSFKLA